MAKAVRAKKLLMVGIIGCLLFAAGDLLFAATAKGQTTERIGFMVRLAYLKIHPDLIGREKVRTAVPLDISTSYLLFHCLGKQPLQDQFFDVVSRGSVST